MSRENNIIMLSHMLDHDKLRELFEELWFKSCKRDLNAFKNALQVLVVYLLTSQDVDEALKTEQGMDDLEALKYKRKVAEIAIDDGAMMELAKELSKLLDSRDTTFTVV